MRSYSFFLCLLVTGIILALACIPLFIVTTKSREGWTYDRYDSRSDRDDDLTPLGTVSVNAAVFSVICFIVALVVAWLPPPAQDGVITDGGPPVIVVRRGGEKGGVVPVYHVRLAISRSCMYARVFWRCCVRCHVEGCSTSGRSKTISP